MSKQFPMSVANVEVTKEIQEWISRYGMTDKYIKGWTQWWYCVTGEHKGTVMPMKNYEIATMGGDTCVWILILETKDGKIQITDSHLQEAVKKNNIKVINKQGEQK